MVKSEKTKYVSQLDMEIADTRAEILALLNCFIDRTFQLFGEQWDFYKQLTVKLYRLKIKKSISESDAELPQARTYYSSDFNI